MYLQLHNEEDINKVIDILKKSNIEVISHFDNIYEKMCEDNIRYYIDSILYDGGGYLSDSNIENKLLEMDEENVNKLVSESTDIMYSNEYLSQTVMECTSDSIEQCLKNLFVKITNE